MSLTVKKFWTVLKTERPATRRSQWGSHPSPLGATRACSVSYGMRMVRDTYGQRLRTAWCWGREKAEEGRRSASAAGAAPATGAFWFVPPACTGGSAHGLLLNPRRSPCQRKTPSCPL